MAARWVVLVVVVASCAPASQPSARPASPSTTGRPTRDPLALLAEARAIQPALLPAPPLDPDPLPLAMPRPAAAPAPALAPHLALGSFEPAHAKRTCATPEPDRELTSYRRAWCQLLVEGDRAAARTTLVRLSNSPTHELARAARADVAAILVDDRREPIAALGFLRAHQLDDALTLDQLVERYVALGRTAEALQVLAALDRRTADPPRLRCARLLQQIALSSGERVTELRARLATIDDPRCDAALESASCPLLGGPQSDSLREDVRRCRWYVSRAPDLDWRVFSVLAHRHWPSHARDPFVWINYADEVWSGPARPVIDQHVLAALRNAVLASDCSPGVLAHVQHVAAKIARIAAYERRMRPLERVDFDHCVAIKRAAISEP